MEELNVSSKSDVKKEVEELVSNDGKVTNSDIEKSLNYEALTPEEKRAIDEFNEKIDITDSTQVLQYGAAAQKKVSDFSDSVLEDVKTKDTGEVGKLLAELVAEIKSFDGAVGEEQKGLSKIFGNAKKSLDRLMAKYSKIETNVDIIEGNLEKQKVQMLKDIAIFDTMYEKNLQFFKEISLYIIAGEKKIEQLRNVELPKLKEQAQKSGEQMDAQKVQDLENTINRFEKKIEGRRRRGRQRMRW